MSEEAKCDCQRCGQPIAFPQEMARQDVSCPHCGRETTLFLPQVSIENPGTTAPAKNDETKTEMPDTTKVLFLIIGFAAVLIPLAFFIHHQNVVAQRERNLQELLNPHASIRDQIDASRDAARLHQEHVDWLAKEEAAQAQHESDQHFVDNLYHDATNKLPPPPTPEEIAAAEIAAAIDKANDERVKRHAEEARTNAVRWLQTLATNGDASAQYRLALHFLTGDGCATNRAEAVRWFKIAAAGGSGEASNKLATLKP